MRDSFVFYRGFYEAILELDTDDQATVYNAICKYSLDGIEPELTGVAAAMFKMAKPQIDANIRRYENGKKGGRPKTEEKPKENQTETKSKPKANQSETEQEPNVNVNDNVNVNVKEKSISNDMPKKKPVKHKHGEYQNVLLTDDELNKLKQEFPLEIDSQIENLSNYLASTGKVYKSHYATIRNWIRRDKEKPPNKITRFVRPDSERGTDYDALFRKMTGGASL